MKNTLYTKRPTYLVLFFIVGCTLSLYGMEGASVYFKASLYGKIYKYLSFLVEEDARPRDDFKKVEWSLAATEVNHRLNKYLLAESGYMSLAQYKASGELRNRYCLYATGTYSAECFILSVRGRFQSTYKVHAERPKNYLHSILTLSYKIGKNGFRPFAHIKVFNDTLNGVRFDKIRFSIGSNYQLNPNNNLQPYYHYHTSSADDPVNYHRVIDICYTHRF